MEVKFPTFVTLHNPRLCVFHAICSTGIIGFAVYQFFMGRAYEIAKDPTGAVNICAQLCQRDFRDEKDFERHALTLREDMICYPHGQDPPPLNFKGFKGQCEGVCGPKVSWPCIPHGEHVQYSPSDVFVTTMVKETIVQNRTGAVTDGSECQPGYKLNTDKGICEHVHSYFVKGFTDQIVAFDHEVRVPRPTSSIFGLRPDLHEQSKVGMATTVMNAAGEAVKVFEPGQRLDMTVRDIFKWAVVDEELTMGSVDAPYTAPIFGVVADDATGLGPTLRTTGARIRVDIWYTNHNGCQRTPDSDELDKPTDVHACITMYLRRSWTTREGQVSQLTDGYTVRREYHGLEFTFYSRGIFKFVDYSRIFKGVTKIAIWAGIPIWVLYFFSVLFLGHLSTMYSRIIHQELSLAGCCVGLAARLMTHSSSFADLADTDEGTGPHHFTG